MIYFEVKLNNININYLMYKFFHTFESLLRSCLILNLSFLFDCYGWSFVIVDCVAFDTCFFVFYYPLHLHPHFHSKILVAPLIRVMELIGLCTLSTILRLEESLAPHLYLQVSRRVKI
jgi:hypothetical protein